MPFWNCGSGSLMTFSPPSERSCSRSPTITLPRSTGPSFAGTSTDKPAGSPLTFGAVRYSEPGSDTGAGPLPTATVAVPTLLASPQAPLAALASEHCTSPLSARLPISPLGSWNVTPLSDALRSGRVKLSV